MNVKAKFITIDINTINILYFKSLFIILTENIIDSLTLTYNREGLKEKLKTLYSSRNETTHGLFMIDLDNFKMINDRKGHDFGDLVLQQFAHILRMNFRKDDIKCRLGGDEFMIFLPSLSQSLLQKRLRDFIELAQKEVFQEYSDLQVSMSIGISTSSRVYQELYIQADEALYKSKKFGKNRYYIYKPTL